MTADNRVVGAGFPAPALTPPYVRVRMPGVRKRMDHSSRWGADSGWPSSAAWSSVPTGEGATVEKALGLDDPR